MQPCAWIISELSVSANLEPLLNMWAPTFLLPGSSPICLKGFNPNSGRVRLRHAGRSHFLIEQTVLPSPKVPKNLRNYGTCRRHQAKGAAARCLVCKQASNGINSVEAPVQSATATPILDLPLFPRRLRTLVPPFNPAIGIRDCRENSCGMR